MGKLQGSMVVSAGKGPVFILFLCFQTGLLRKVQGMGWFLEESNVAQVSTNLLDYEVTPLHRVYEEVCREAQVWSYMSLDLCSRDIFVNMNNSVQELKLPVVGSQIVGLVPLKAILEAADFYIDRDQLFIIEEEHKVRLV